MTTPHTFLRFRLRALLVVVSGAAAVLALGGAPAAAGGGNTAAQLERAGWTCIDQGADHPTPCFPDADAVFSGEVRTSIVKTFGPAGEEFWGTEFLIHQDLYQGQPCPRDEVEGGDGGYIDLEPIQGMPYYVCHHFDSPET